MLYLLKSRHYNTMETFPVLSYPINNMDGLKTKAEYGLHSLGLVNTLAIPVATDNLAITIDPRQLIRCIRYYRVNYILTNLNHTTTCMVHKTVPQILPQSVVNIKIANTPTMVRYITRTADVLSID